MPWIRAIVLVVLLSAPAVAAPSSDAVHPIEPTIAMVKLEAAPEVPVWLVEAHRVPMVSLQLQFARAGFAYDPADKQGQAMMAAQLLTEGAGSHDAAEFQKLLESHAIQLSASVDEDGTMVRLSTLKEHAPLAFSLMADALTKPRFDADALARLQRLADTTLHQLEEDPGYVASRAWRAKAYGTHPYAQLKRGTLATVSTITTDGVREFAKRHWVRPALRVAVSGDVTPAELSAWLAPLVAALPTTAMVPALPAATPPAQAVVESIVKDVPQTQFIFSLPALNRAHPDYFAQMVLNQMVGGDALSSHLAQLVRDKHGLTYGIGTAIDTNAAGALWVGSFSTRNTKAAEALGLVRNCLSDSVKKGFSAQEIREAKDYLQGSLATQLDGTLAMAEFLATLQRYGLTPDYFHTRTARIEAVTAADIHRLAVQMFAGTPLVVVAVGSPMPALPSSHSLQEAAPEGKKH